MRQASEQSKAEQSRGLRRILTGGERVGGRWLAVVRRCMCCEKAIQTGESRELVEALRIGYGVWDKGRPDVCVWCVGPGAVL